MIVHCISLEEAHHIMNNHSIMIYPIDIETLFETNKWINAYECYFKNMLGLSNVNYKVSMHLILFSN